MGFRSSQAAALGPELAACMPKDGIPWYKKKHLLKLNFCMFCLFMFASANGYDGSMMNGLQALPQWQTFMNTPTGAWLGFINAVQSLGAFCCYPVVAWSNNKFGRKKSIAVGYFWLALGVSIQTAAQNPAMFVVGRLCIGGVSSFFGASAPILITETAFPSHRATITSIFNSGWYVGSLLAAWATYGTREYTTNWAWRVPSILQALIPVVFAVGFLMAPESPRWLASVGRGEEARQFFIDWHAGGDASSPLAKFEYEEVVKTLALEREANASTTYVDMFKTKGNRLRSYITITLGLSAQWAGNGIVSYYLVDALKLSGITSVTQQTLISGFLQIWNLIWAVSAAFMVDNFGRRPMFLASCLGMLGSYIVVSGLSGSFATTQNEQTGIAIIPFLFLFFASYCLAFTPLIVSYTCEIWEFSYRAKGVSLCQFVTQLAIFFNIFVNPIALDAISWKFYIVYCVLLVFITANVWFFYPETKGHSLEEISLVFDRRDAKVEVPVIHEAMSSSNSEKDAKIEETVHAESKV